MRRLLLHVPVEGYGIFACTFQSIHHRDKTESLICRTKLVNGKRCVLTAKFVLLPKPDINGHEWHVKCHGMETHAYDKEKIGVAVGMFRWWLKVLTSWVEEREHAIQR